MICQHKFGIITEFIVSVVSEDVAMRHDLPDNTWNHLLVVSEDALIKALFFNKNLEPSVSCQ